jgi:hypothetical protein
MIVWPPGTNYRVAMAAVGDLYRYTVIVGI